MHIFSHRGHCREALENSWQAFDLSLEAKIDGIELDVHMTKDQEFVVIHDKELSRTAKSSGLVKNMTRKELSQIQLSNQGKIPFLDEVLAKYVPQLEINIEIKDYSEAAAKAFAEFYEKCSNQERLIVSAISPETLIWLNDLVPQIRLGIVYEPLGFRRLRPYMSYFLNKLINRVDLEAVHPIIDLIEARNVEMFNSLGLKINAWFPSASEKSLPDPHWSKALDLEIDSIITNEPRAMQKWLTGQVQKTDV